MPLLGLVLPFEPPVARMMTATAIAAKPERCAGDDQRHPGSDARPPSAPVRSWYGADGGNGPNVPVAFCVGPGWDGSSVVVVAS